MPYPKQWPFIPSYLCNPLFFKSFSFGIWWKCIVGSYLPSELHIGTQQCSLDVPVPVLLELAIVVIWPDSSGQCVYICAHFASFWLLEYQVCINFEKGLWELRNREVDIKDLPKLLITLQECTLRVHLIQHNQHILSLNE